MQVRGGSGLSNLHKMLNPGAAALVWCIWVPSLPLRSRSQPCTSLAPSGCAGHGHSMRSAIAQGCLGARPGGRKRTQTLAPGLQHKGLMQKGQEFLQAPTPSTLEAAQAPVRGTGPPLQLLHAAGGAGLRNLCRRARPWCAGHVVMHAVCRVVQQRALHKVGGS